MEIVSAMKTGIWEPMVLSRQFDFSGILRIFVHCRRNRGKDKGKRIVVETVQSKMLIYDAIDAVLLGEIIFDWINGVALTVPEKWGNIQLLKFLDELIEEATVCAC